MIEIENLSPSDEIIVAEKRIGPSESYEIHPLDLSFWANRDDVIEALSDGLIQVKVNGTAIDGLSNQINVLKQINDGPRTLITKIPKVAIYDAEGDFSTHITHDFCDSSSWNNGSSEWILAPQPGKVLMFKMAEVQFTHDVVMKNLTELYFDVMGYNPNDLPNKMIYERITYKSIRDVLNIGNAHWTMPPVDDISFDQTTVQFNYPRAIAIKASQGMQIRLSLKDNVPISGEFCTVSFVTAEVDE